MDKFWDCNKDDLIDIVLIFVAMIPITWLVWLAVNL